MDATRPLTKPSQRPSSSSTTTTTTTCCPPQQKLKDSCDLCSASKVRCNKQKPSCGRCDKLGYPCFYSPARRGGRPYRPRTQSSLSQSSIGVGQSQNQSHNQNDGPGTRERLGSSSSRNENESALSTSPPQRNEPRDIEHHKPSLSTASSQPHPNHAPSTSDASSSPDAEDCATVAMDMLAHLDLTSASLSSSSAPTSPSSANANPETISTAIHTITTSFRALSTILICPCSERADVGVLAAAVCLTILDIHSAIIRLSSSSSSATANPSNRSGSSNHPSSPSDQPQLGQINLNTWGMDRDRMDVCTKCFADRPEEEAATMRVLGELPKVAKVVLQFTKRYSGAGAERRAGTGTGRRGNGGGDGGDCAQADFLPALAAFLRGRLQDIADEATDGLV